MVRNIITTFFTVIYLYLTGYSFWEAVTRTNDTMQLAFIVLGTITLGLAYLMQVTRKKSNNYNDRP